MARYKKNEEAAKNVGKNIRKYRDLKGLTLVELSYKTDIQPKSIWTYEQGKVNINITTIYTLADGLEVKPHQLLMDFEE